LEEAVMDRLVFAFYRALGAIIRALPIETGFRLGRALGAIGYHIAVPYRRLAMHNLGIAFGGEKSPAELRELARRHFCNLGANLFASLKLPTLSREEIEARVTVEGLEHMDEQLARKGGFVFVISHLGNWEMFAQLTPYAFKSKVGTIYQALGNPHIDADVRRDRARLGLALFERKEGFNAAAKYIREGGSVGVLIDQHAGDAGLWCPFFGRLASTTTLAATLALRANACLIPAAVYTDGIARWRCVLLPQVKPDGQSPQMITRRINEILEQQIRVQPEDWFWVHNRWKTPRPKFLLATYKRGVALASDVTPGRDLQPFRMVIRGSNWLGDAVMSVPAVRAIKRGRPDAHLTILTPAKLADFWRTVAGVDVVLAVEPGDGVFAVARKLRSGNFDAAIVFPNSLRTALEPWFARIPRRVGFPGHRRAWLLNQIPRDKKSKKKGPQAPRHQVHHYLQLAEFIGADISFAAEVTNEHWKKGNRESNADRNSRIAEHHSPLRLGLCPGAEYGPTKRWLPERFAETMRAVHESTRCEWRIFGVAKDRAVADEIMQLAATPVTDLVGKTTLAELIERLRECDLLLTNDTGTMHLAAYLGVPVVAIFGSTEPSLTGPLNLGQDARGTHTILRHHVECSPCFLRECPIDFRCMKAVTSAEVIAAIEERLPLRRLPR
jgi:lipopolysaccharide heptosyltransferase II